jgi:hypothetical protein
MDDWTNFYVNMYVTPTLSTVRGFTGLTKSSSFVDHNMFMRYYGCGVGHRDSAAVIEVTSDPEEVMYESPDARFKFEDTEESDHDDGDEVDDPGESTDEGMANVYSVSYVAVHP